MPLLAHTAAATASTVAVLVPLCQGELPLITHAMVTGGGELLLETELSKIDDFILTLLPLCIPFSFIVGEM